tara:strand:- start:380 stop:1201 length:822 start_codon:yes stop_codon:yes gene_type:complete
MKHIYLILLLLSISNIGRAQSNDSSETNDTPPPPTKNLFINFGGTYSSFQDIKFSNTKYAGKGFNAGFGFNKTTTKSFWESSLNFNCSKENANTHSSGPALVINANIYFKYLRPLKNNFLIGGRVDAIDFYFRKVEGLGNNSVYYINSHHLYGSLIHHKKINENWNLESSVDLGLLSFMKELTSFGFSAPQNALEDGEFTYQNDALSNPFGYKYFEWKHIANNINIKTAFLFKYKERISVGYSWNLRHFSNLKSYPVTTGLHNITFRYNIIHK